MELPPELVTPLNTTIGRNKAIAAIQRLADDLELIGLSKQCVSDWVDEQVKALPPVNSTK